MSDSLSVVAIKKFVAATSFACWVWSGVVVDRGAADEPPSHSTRWEFFQAMAEASAKTVNQPRESVIVNPLAQENPRDLVWEINWHHIDVDSIFGLHLLVLEVAPEHVETIDRLFDKRKRDQEENFQIDVAAAAAAKDRQAVIAMLLDQEDRRSSELADGLGETLSGDQLALIAKAIVRRFGAQSLTHPLVRRELAIEPPQLGQVRDRYRRMRQALFRQKPADIRSGARSPELDRAFVRLMASLTPEQLRHYLLLRGELKDGQGPRSIEGEYSPEVKNAMLELLDRAEPH